MRNPNGYGSVYKLSGKNRRNPYVAKVTVGWGENGRQQYTVVGYYPTREAALIALAAYHQGTVKPASAMTLGDVYNEWSAIHYDQIGESTKKQYTAAYAKMEPLHNVRFCDLRTAHFQKIIHAHRNLKKGTIAKVKILAGQLYKYAIQHDIANRNYAAFIQLPKDDRAEKQVFTDTEIQALWNHQNDPMVDSILILIYTGFRVGEMLALTRFSVDFVSGTLTGGEKTEAGKNRVVPIHHKILPLIHKRYDEAAEDGRLVPLTYEQYRRAYYNALDGLGIARKTPHCTRHTFATLMSRNGADTKALQKIIGHADYSTTANIYTHTNLDDLKKAIESI